MKRQPSTRGKLKQDTNNVCVMVRVRPFSKREIDLSAEKGEPLKSVVDMDGAVVSVMDEDDNFDSPKQGLQFAYDYCFWSIPEDDCQDFPFSPNGFARQEEVYEVSGKEALLNAWEAYNTCIFAYGQTGSGKSYSMLGTTNGEHMGISPRIVDNLFRKIEEDKVAKPKTIYKVECTFLEIYNEQVRDLFAKDKNNSYASVKIRQHPVYGVQVQGLEAKVVDTAISCKEEMDHGIGQRALASTKMNATSSRSHAIFQIHIYTSETDSKTRGHATINLVDLAGSERIGKTGATGETAAEGRAINLSLTTLRKVIDVLIENSKGAKKVPPYREAMLTWVLKDSLGGNSKTMMICTISPHSDNLEDTVSTLRYGLKAKAIVCKAIKQEVKADKQARELKNQIAELEAALQAAQDAGGSTEEAKELTEQLELQKEEFDNVQKDLDKMLEREADLKCQVIEQKKSRFASAFRSAFVLEKKKSNMKQLQENTAMLEQSTVKLKCEVEEYQKQVEQTEGVLERTKREKADMEKLVNTQEEQLGKAESELRTEEAARRSVEKKVSRAADTLASELGETAGDLKGPDALEFASRKMVDKHREMASQIKTDTRVLQDKESELTRLKNTHEEATAMATRQTAALENMVQRERQKAADSLETLREVREKGSRAESMLQEELAGLRHRSEDELHMMKQRLDYERKEYAQKQDEQSHLVNIANNELDELRKLVKQLQAELYVAEETINDLSHRKDHYKKQCHLLREMHEADTKIIKSLSSERCMSSDVVAAAVRMSSGQLGEKARALQPILDEKAETMQRLSGALGTYQEAAVEWMSSPNVVGGGSRTRREERAREKLTVWLQEGGSPVSPRGGGSGPSFGRPRSNSRSRTRASAAPADSEALAAYSTWQGSPYGVRAGSPAARIGSPGSPKQRR